MGMFAKFLFRRKYIKSLRVISESAINSWFITENIINNVILSEKDNAFTNYVIMLDLGDEAVKTCKHYANMANLAAERNVAMDFVNLAMVYEKIYKKLVFMGLALASIGGFQPLRAKEMLEVKIKYPTLP